MGACCSGQGGCNCDFTSNDEGEKADAFHTGLSIAERQSQFRDWTLRVITWNVGNAEPDLEWLPWSGEDIVVVGVQESSWDRESESDYDSDDDSESINKKDVAKASEEKSKDPDSKVDQTTTTTTTAPNLDKQTTTAEAPITLDQIDAIAEDGPMTKEQQDAKAHDKALDEKASLVTSSETETSDSWFQALREKFAEHKYHSIKCIAMGDIKIAAFCKDEIKDKIRNEKWTSEATGLMHLYHNKGGVCLTFTVQSTRLCFINSHLAAHQEYVERRNSDIKEIFSGISDKLNPLIQRYNMDVMHNFHHLFFFGDMNYRVEYGDQGTDASPSKEQHSEMVGLINDNKFVETLLEGDQLRTEMKNGRTLYGFKEGDITFKPTFKVLRDKNPPEYNTKRSPAWCDRIIYKSLPNLELKQTEYINHEDAMSSDHKPVSASFIVPAFNRAPMLCEEIKNVTITISELKGKDFPAADLNGKSDPYLLFYGATLEHRLKTSVAPSTLDPVWEDVLTFETSEYTNPDWLAWTYFYVQAMDKDVITASDELGQAILPLKECVEADGAETPFHINMTRDGLKCGELSGKIAIKYERAII